LREDRGDQRSGAERYGDRSDQLSNGNAHTSLLSD
jgi:hypothetical protein